MSDEKRFSLGLDFGTNSMRALIVDVTTGDEIAGAVSNYPSGEDGVLLDAINPNIARQHPNDYLVCLNESVSDALRIAGEAPGFDSSQLVGIGIDTTGSTPMPVDGNCNPLAFDPEYRDRLAACAWLWKDHSSHEEAEEITELAKKREEPYLAKCGGSYSPEWLWSKALHCARTDERLFQTAHSWVELCDFVPAYLAGKTDPLAIKRSACAAGHKAMFHSEWGGLPSKSFLQELSPELASLRDRMYVETFASDVAAGTVCGKVADETGIPLGTPIAVGQIDAHAGAVGAGVREGVLVKILGTSSCDIMVAPMVDQMENIPGICGIAEESVLPQMLGLEAGQAAVGDLYNWFVKRVLSEGNDWHETLTEQASNLQPGESGLIALDWNNGNRSVLADPKLTGLLIGQNLHTNASHIYRALIEATAFGALRIIEQMERHGIGIDEVVCCGGIAEKSPLVLQIYADVCNRPMKVSRSSQTCALGAAVFGSVVGGFHPDVASAQRAMTGTKSTVYSPDPKRAETYGRLYAVYCELHDSFGSKDSAMKKLLEIQRSVKE